MSNLVEHAKKELKIAGWEDQDDFYDGMIAKAVVEVVQKVADQGHSGMSAGLMISILNKVLRFEPLTPLTGEDDEWYDHGNGTWQNIRCSRVFKDTTRAYDIEAIRIEDSRGELHYPENWKTITFPYTPETETIYDPDYPLD